MAITLVGTVQTGNAANGADVTLTFDGTPAEDDVVVVIGGNAGGEAADPAGPSTAGYTEDTRTDDNTIPVSFGVWYKALGASPDANVVCQGSGNAADATAYTSFVLRGVNTATVIDTATQSAGPTTDAAPDPPSITTVTDGAWVVASCFHGEADTINSGPAGYSNFSADAGVDTNRFSVGVASNEVASAGAEDPGTFSLSGSAVWYALTVAIRPDTGAVAKYSNSWLISRKPFPRKNADRLVSKNLISAKKIA